MFTCSFTLITIPIENDDNVKSNTEMSNWRKYDKIQFCNCSFNDIQQEVNKIDRTLGQLDLLTKQILYNIGKNPLANCQQITRKRLIILYLPSKDADPIKIPQSDLLDDSQNMRNRTTHCTLIHGFRLFTQKTT